jgi:hypothetical protein
MCNREQKRSRSHAKGPGYWPGYASEEAALTTSSILLHDIAHPNESSEFLSVVVVKCLAAERHPIEWQWLVINMQLFLASSESKMRAEDKLAQVGFGGHYGLLNLMSPCSLSRPTHPTTGGAWFIADLCNRLKYVLSVLQLRRRWRQRTRWGSGPVRRLPIEVLYRIRRCETCFRVDEISTSAERLCRRTASS